MPPLRDVAVARLGRAPAQGFDANQSRGTAKGAGARFAIFVASLLIIRPRWSAGAVCGGAAGLPAAAPLFPRRAPAGGSSCVSAPSVVALRMGKPFSISGLRVEAILGHAFSARTRSHPGGAARPPPRCLAEAAPAREAREQAHRATDPLIKAKLHEIANSLEKAADDLERISDPERRS
jgi:hypothetical protein